MVTNEIPTSSTVKYILCEEVQVSIEDLTDTEILKLNKSELQIGLKEMRLLHLKSKAENSDLRGLIVDFDAMVKLLEKNGYMCTLGVQMDSYSEKDI